VGTVEGIWVKFVYEGHWVKVKDTGVKSTKIAIPGIVFLQCKTLISSNSGFIEGIAVKFVQHEAIRYGKLNGVTTIFVTCPEVTRPS